jgi:hypothetical protein
MELTAWIVEDGVNMKSRPKFKKSQSKKSIKNKKCTLPKQFKYPNMQCPECGGW